MFATLAVGISTGAPLADDPNEVKIVRSEQKHFPDGSYSYLYELSDGQFKEESGTLSKVGDEFILIVNGNYGFIDGNGNKYRVDYISDENGFRATGDHLPDQEQGPYLTANTPFTYPLDHEIDPNLLKSIVGWLINFSFSDIFHFCIFLHFFALTYL